MSRKYLLLGIWMFSSLLAAAMALEYTHSTYYEPAGTPPGQGEWHPVGNDSFYHARRILDAADPEVGLYQFDEKIHAPEGSWLTWPWAYDWLLAKLVQIWLFFDPAEDSMMIITHMAVYWIFVNGGLLLLTGVVLNLRIGLIAIMMLGYALSPLTQALHGVGLIDHHYVEHTFILLTLLTGLAWLKRPEKVARAIALGVALGIAPAFHTGLFIMQAPVLLTLFILWLRKDFPPKDSVLALAVALTLAMLAALIPSEPFQQGQFQFSVLSWFHLYIAATSTLFISAMARLPYSPKVLLGFCLLGFALLIPIWQDALGGASFLGQKIALLDQISETQSPWQMMTGSRGFWATIGFYSTFLLLTPLLIVAYLWRGYHARSQAELFFAVMVVFGMALFLTQFRLHYFGSFALILGWLLILREQRWFNRMRASLTNAAGVVLVLLLYIPSFEVLFYRYTLGWDDMYISALPAMEVLAERCAEEPGIVLTDNNYGHILRYHTDCSVIANNFLMTPQHEAKIDEMWAYLEMSPEELLQERPEEMRYVFTRLANFARRTDDGGTELTDNATLERLNLRLPYELNTRQDLPEEYKTIFKLMLDNERPFTAIRVLEITPTAGSDQTSKN